MQLQVNNEKLWWKNWRLTIIIFSLFFTSLLPSSVFAEIFCIQNQDEFNQALTISLNNKANDILKIVQGTNLEKVKLKNETGFLMKIEGGYSSDCTFRIEAPNLPQDYNHAIDSPKNDIIPQQNTTGPTPPDGLEPKKELFSGGDLSGGSDVTILGVPSYAWRHGCGPTSLGMVVGFWDINGCSDLFDGSATTQTNSVNQGIASQGSTTAPMHYEDYSLPEDSYPNMLNDKSELPAGDEHMSDSIADFMFTSWSYQDNYYGWSWSNHITPAFTNYVQNRNNSYNPSTETYYYGSSLTWDVLTTEIDAQRPMVFLVDSSGSGQTDHFATVVGYRVDGTTRYYGCLDTWYPYDTVRWVQFRGLSSSYTWGVWSGYSFQLTCPNQTKAKNIVPIYNLLLGTGQ